MGDFNAGPDNPDKNIEALWEDNYLEILFEGFDSAILEDDELAPFCTLCPSINPVFAFQFEDVLVDHIFVRNAKSSNPRRLLDDPISLTGPDGNTRTAFRSDHYGYQATVTFDLAD